MGGFHGCEDSLAAFGELSIAQHLTPNVPTSVLLTHHHLGWLFAGVHNLGKAGALLKVPATGGQGAQFPL